jgi:hypothetical protein
MLAQAAKPGARCLLKVMLIPVNATVVTACTVVVVAGADDVSSGAGAVTRPTVAMIVSDDSRGRHNNGKHNAGRCRDRRIHITERPIRVVVGAVTVTMTVIYWQSN